MKNNRKVLYGLVALALLLSVVGISIGFASLSQELVITGTAEVVPASWDIHFANLQSADTEGGATTTGTPTLTNTLISGINVTLTKPGDSVSYEFDVENDGDIDAEFDDLVWGNLTYTGAAADSTIKENDEQIVEDNLVITLTYADDTALTQGDDLDHNDSVTLKLTIAYDENADELPSDTVTITGIRAALTYVQK